MYLPGIDWKSKMVELRNFVAENSANKAVSDLAAKTLNSIQDMQEIKEKLAIEDGQAKIIQENIPWKFTLVAFILATIGVSIKCARAANEFFVARKEPQ
jgi:hypothetical protein